MFLASEKFNHVRECGPGFCKNLMEATMERSAEMTNNSAGKAVEQAHAELLNFIGPDGLLLDYRGEIPTARDCAECRPNAKGWWTPIENGPMFTAPWLVAVCRRAEISGLAEDRALSRRLARGLLRAASLSTTPGFIARGEGAERGCHYPIGSMDQTLPWFYGLYVYQKSGGADPEVADNARKTMLAVADAIAKNDWKCPCEAPFDAETCGDFRNEGAPFRNAVHGLFLFRILGELAPEHYGGLYEEMAHSKARRCDMTRLEACAKGYEADIPVLPNLEPGLLWIYVCAQGCLRELARLEPDEQAFKRGLKANAKRAAHFMALRKGYDNSTEVPFRYANWRTGYMWREQKTIADSDRVASTGDEAILGTRKKFERAYMTAPLSAAAICALAGESPQEVAKTLAHYDYATLNLSEFFLAEVAWFTQ